MKAPAWALIVHPNSLTEMAVKRLTKAHIVKMMMTTMKMRLQRVLQQHPLLEPRVFLHLYCRTEPAWLDGAMALAG